MAEGSAGQARPRQTEDPDGEPRWWRSLAAGLGKRQQPRGRIRQERSEASSSDHRPASACFRIGYGSIGHRTALSPILSLLR